MTTQASPARGPDTMDAVDLGCGPSVGGYGNARARDLTLATGRVMCV